MASGWSREGTSVCAIPKPLAPLCSPVPLSCPADFTPRTCCVALGWAFSLSGTQHTLLVGWSRRLPQPWHFESPCVQLTLGADFQATEGRVHRSPPCSHLPSLSVLARHPGGMKHAHGWCTLLGHVLFIHPLLLQTQTLACVPPLFFQLTNLRFCLLTFIPFAGS